MNSKSFKVIYFVIIFIIFGEITARFYLTLHTKSFAPPIKNETELQGSEEYGKNLIIIGDSYSAGFGIPSRSRLSTLLKNMKTHNVYDFTAADNNWLNYLNKLDKSKSIVKKDDFIIILTTFADILYKNDAFNEFFSKPIADFKLSINDTIKKGDIEIDYRVEKSVFKKIYKLIKSKSHLFELLVRNIKTTLKNKGLLLPFGDFYYLYKEGYIEKKHEIEKILAYIDNFSNDHGINIIIYLLPDFNTLGITKYFTHYTSAYEKSFNNKSVKIIDGINHFKGKNSHSYCISLRDAHPNGKAHAVIADSLKNQINNFK